MQFDECEVPWNGYKTKKYIHPPIPPNDMASHKTFSGGKSGNRDRPKLYSRNNYKSEKTSSTSLKLAENLDYLNQLPLSTTLLSSFRPAWHQFFLSEIPTADNPTNSYKALKIK